MSHRKTYLNERRIMRKLLTSLVDDGWEVDLDDRCGGVPRVTPVREAMDYMLWRRAPAEKDCWNLEEVVIRASKVDHTVRQKG